ncbi:MGMT family protein [Pelagibaculum spongiae]|uniref:Cysteine methyltransferase n=1 Tax=Pelagibaculum spongiae TaxID=2080658 RepID=A0A2V1GXK4_9GAMM|nr:MGMT family protein [Pelagibaculum spongiae]PVZ71516.1 cysteine methyltransferase [Pelagibaculum spongiae]
MTEEFHQAVLLTISDIPHGRVSSYGVIAGLAGFPGYARQVGRLLAQLPQGSSIPWHRVINGQGKISRPLDSEAFLRQKKRLQDEGISVNNGRISLKQYGWGR